MIFFDSLLLGKVDVIKYFTFIEIKREDMPEQFEGSPSETKIEETRALTPEEKEIIKTAKEKGQDITLVMDGVTAIEDGLVPQEEIDNPFETIEVVVSPEKAEECLKKGKCGISKEEEKITKSSGIEPLGKDRIIGEN